MNHPNLERLLADFPFKTAGIILELEDWHKQVIYFGSDSENAAIYNNRKKQTMLQTYSRMIPNERVLIGLYSEVNLND